VVHLHPHLGVKISLRNSMRTWNENPVKNEKEYLWGIQNLEKSDFIFHF
jgi:hypothetical protein